MFKRALSFLLVLVLCVGAVPAMAAETQPPVNMEETVAVSGDSSFGNMLAAEIEDKLADQQENNGYRIFEVTVADVTATVELEAVEDCTLVVGLYTEDGVELLVSGWAEIAAGDSEAVVQLETAQMPEYFYLKAFLVDEETSPLCPAYSTPNYTREMQEFFATTVEDFEADRVLNLDDNPQNNFAVFKETVKRIDVNGKNTLSTSGEYYIFDDADETAKNLQPGDIITCPYNGDTLILVVATVQVAGDTVTLTEADAELEDVFDYVKIDGETGLGEASVGEANCPEGVTFDGLEPPAARARTIDFEGGASLSAKFTFLEKKVGKDAKFSGSLNFSANASVAVYLTLSYSYIEVEIDYAAQLTLGFSGKVELFTLPLGVPFTFVPVPGITIKITPSFVGEVSGKVEFSGTLKGTIAFSANTDEGAKNLSATPSFDAELKGEFTVFVGLSLEPEVALVHDKLLKASIDATVGVEVSGEISTKTIADEHHQCNACLDGDISAKMSLEFEVEFLNNDKWSFKLKLIDRTLKVADFYWAIDKGEFGFGTCPYISYKMEVTVVCADGTKAIGADVTFEGDGKSFHVISEGSGVAIAYVPNGTYTVKVAFGDEVGTVKKWKVKNQDRKFTVQLAPKPQGSGFANIQSVVISPDNFYNAAITGAGELYMWGRNSRGQLGVETEMSADFWNGHKAPIFIKEKITKVAMGDSHTAAITEDGDLYMWGENGSGQLGNGKTGSSSTPLLVMENVKDVSLSGYVSAAVNEDGELFIWGRTSDIFLETGTNETLTPYKVTDEVQAVWLASQHYVILKENGDLYVGGDNVFGQVGDGGMATAYTPVRVMSNVKDVTVGGSNTAAITEDGDLYMWGWNLGGNLGVGHTKHVYSPQKVMSGVKTVCPAGWRTLALTEGGQLYAWGTNYNSHPDLAQQGKNYTPVLIAEDVKDFAVGSKHFAVLKTDGKLYTWGENKYGQLGDGTKENRPDPTYVMSGVAKVYCGSLHTVAIDEQGNLYTWGDNSSAQLGDGTREGKDSPVKITEESAATAADTAAQAAALPIAARMRAATNTVQTATFDGLTPGELYNFYVMKDKAAAEPFDAENLLYIDQGVAGEDGTLTFRYVAEGGERVLVGEPAPAPAGVLGDVDGDETITSTDARMTLQFYAGKISESALNTALADVDGDGSITSTDARLILQYYAGKIEGFPAA